MSRDRPIADYGLVGDTRTAGLVSSAGSLDWMCVPRFDGEPVFGRLVGGAEAGRFLLGPLAPEEPADRGYRPDTVTLETSWRTPAGRLVLTEGMVGTVTGRLLPRTLLVRRLTAVGGPAQAVVEFDPRLGERHREPRTRHRPGRLVCEFGALALSLASDAPVEVAPGRRVELTVTPDRPITFVMGVMHHEPLVHVPPAQAWEVLLEDEARWRRWTDEIHADVPFRDAVTRSLLTLRLLTYSPSGAPVAAPTTSLPEHPGGLRNWDYRYAWPRDASIGIAAFLGAGKPNEARRFLSWLLHASRLHRPNLPALLTLHGRRAPQERDLDGWPGYAASVPVRIGNGAAEQHQLDGYGWVLDAAWVLVGSGQRLNSETWRAMRGFADRVAGTWAEPDAGIWEIRGDGAHHVHSKLMAWLALDRALRIAATHRLPERRRRRWRSERDAIAADVRARGRDPVTGGYTRTYGSVDLDAALLVLPLLGLEPPGSPAVRQTVDAVAERLTAGDPLLYRYPPGEDGLAGTEGAFLPCSFWLVQALTLTDRRQEAEAMFGRLLSLATPLGLYAEEMDPASHEHLGNFPQALTHAALVQAALALKSQ